METLTTTLLHHPHSHPRPPQQPPCHHPLSSLPHLLTSRSSLFVRKSPPPCPRPRCDVFIITPHAVRAPNFYLDPRSFRNDDENNDDEEEENDVGSVRRMRKRRSGRESKQRRWWSDEVEEDDDDEPKAGILDQAVDNLWILQVFRSYGLFLPVILISLLLATGPKAFLVGSGIPFGLSALFFAFKKLSEWLYGSPKTKPRRRRKSPLRDKGDVFREEEDEQREERQQGKRNRRRAYRTRVTQDDRRVYDRYPDSGGVNDFGGWDELVSEDETMSTQRPPQSKDRLEMMTEKVKVNSALKQKKAPLLLRLLIAVFPFFGSWISLL